MSESVPGGMSIALVVHGHFYQPPRENPWTDEIPREPSAAPFHDWNARIHAESYRANAFARIHDGTGRIESIVNNYDRLSFNFGPTLARYVERHDPQTQARLAAADGVQRRRLAHGGAIAQAYAHPIVPLLSPADRRTQLLWGLADFRRRFGREADGLWLPETGVSPATLETLIDLGVSFTILGPEQIAAVRATSRDDWQPVNRDTLDTGCAYFWRHRDGSGRRIAIAVFDGPLSRTVAFGEAAANAEAFLQAVRASAERSKSEGQRLVLCASDGELFGHHKKFADLTLAFATHIEAPRRGIEVTNLAAYMARHPPTRELQLAPGPNDEGTAWSCSHGLGRWTRDCGCSMGTGPGWNQKWRGPLRRGLDIVRDAAAAFYEDAGSDLLVDPWGARDAYGEVVDAPLPVRDRAILAFARPALAGGNGPALERARLLLELQRATLLMYASCGWFFDDIAGLEASLVIRMAAHAIDLLREAGATPPTTEVLEALGEGRSNRPQDGTGADVFRRALRDRVTPAHAIGRAALSTLAGGTSAGGPGYEVGFSRTAGGSAPGGSSLTGRAWAREKRTGRVAEAEFSALRRRGGAFEVRVGDRRFELRDLGDEARSAVIMAALPDLVDEASDPTVAHLILLAARDMPPDRETPEGVQRQVLLGRVLVALLTPPARGRPTAEALNVATELLEVADLPPTSRQRRELEELVWAELERGRPTVALRALAAKLGFAPAPAEPASESAAS
jgi:alpha-amylase/alpha-mannosidase (GH57 family)